MKRMFFLTVFSLLFVASHPGFTRQLASELPSKEPVVLQAETQKFSNPFPLTWLGRLAERLESFSLSPLVGEAVFCEFVFLNPARHYAGQITQLSATFRPFQEPTSADPGVPPKVPP